MYELLSLVLALFMGALLGVIFFGGLWWTVQKGISSKRPALLFLGSLFVRTIITLTGFYFISQGSWQRLMSCLLGFIIVRFIMVRMEEPHAT